MKITTYIVIITLCILRARKERKSEVETCCLSERERATLFSEP